MSNEVTVERLGNDYTSPEGTVCRAADGTAGKWVDCVSLATHDSPYCTEHRPFFLQHGGW